MEYVITRLEDPHPKTGNRLFPANAWSDRPASMKSEVCFLLNPDETWSTIRDISKFKEGEDGAYLTLITDDGEHLNTEDSKLIYVTEEQLERVSYSKREEIKADINSRDCSPEVKKKALARLAQIFDTEKTLPMQYELRVVGQEVVDLQPLAWAVADCSKRMVDWLPVRSKDPFEDGMIDNAIDTLEIANRAFPDKAPHHWKVLFG